MTREELIGIVREEVLDDVDACLSDDQREARWSDAQLLRWSGEAERQACRRGDMRYLLDSTTEECCRITLQQGVTEYRLDRRVLRLDAVHRADGAPLVHATRLGMDQLCPRWREAQAGAPRMFFVMGRSLFLDRAPSVVEAGTALTLSVWREPLVSSPVLETPFEWPLEIEGFKHWMAYQAFSLRDEDVADRDVAARHLMLFERIYGPPLDVGVMRHKLETPSVLRHHAGIHYFHGWYGGGVDDED